MRKLVIALSLLAAVSAFGQVRVSVFVVDLEFSSGEGVGGALEYQWDRHWSAEVSASSEKHDVGFFSRTKVKSQDLDAVVRYHFANDTRWDPFLGAGVHHFSSSDSLATYDDKTTPELDGGFYFNVTPHFALRVDGKLHIRNDEQGEDSGWKSMIGVAWKF
jgi:opacity protein-like surface antigen